MNTVPDFTVCTSSKHLNSVIVSKGWALERNNFIHVNFLTEILLSHHQVLEGTTRNYQLVVIIWMIHVIEHFSRPVFPTFLARSKVFFLCLGVNKCRDCPLSGRLGDKWSHACCLVSALIPLDSPDLLDLILPWSLNHCSRYPFSCVKDWVFSSSSLLEVYSDLVLWIL